MFGKQAIAISEQTRSEPETTNNTDNKTAKQKGIEAALVVYGRDDKGKAHASSFPFSINRLSPGIPTNRLM